MSEGHKKGAFAAHGARTTPTCTHTHTIRILLVIITHTRLLFSSPALCHLHPCCFFHAWALSLWCWLTHTLLLWFLYPAQRVAFCWRGGGGPPLLCRPSSTALSSESPRPTLFVCSCFLRRVLRTCAARAAPPYHSYCEFCLALSLPPLLFVVGETAQQNARP